MGILSPWRFRTIDQERLRLLRMGDVIPFKPKKPGQKHQGKSLCRDGFHKWELVGDQVFDVKQGKLVSKWVCKRCGAIKTKAT